MRKTKVVAGWVVYKSRHSGPDGSNAVCEQEEWDAMERNDPGMNTLIRAGISSEAEAERLAREAPGGTAEKQAHLRARPPKR
jgi:hypothetical protein